MSAPEIVACEGRAPKVKPLEWRDLTNRLSGSHYYSAAETPMGGVRAAKITDGKWTVEIFGRKLRNYLDSVETYSTLHEAKAAAEADYTASVLACLERALETELGRMASRLQEANTYVDEEHALSTPAASPVTEAVPAEDSLVLVRRDMLASACAAIRLKKDAPVTVEYLRSAIYAPPPASPSPAPAAAAVMAEKLMEVAGLQESNWKRHRDVAQRWAAEAAAALSTLAADKARAEAERDDALANVEWWKDYNSQTWARWEAAEARATAAEAERDTLRRSHASAEQALRDVVAERDEALDRAEGQWVGWVREGVARKAAEARASALEGEVEKMRPHVAKIVGSVRINDSMGRVVTGQTEAATELGKLFAALSPAKETTDDAT